MCEHYGWTRIASGELLRAAAEAGTPAGIKAKTYLDAGRLVPDAVIEQLILDRMAQPDCHTGVVLDGFPRTVAQATALDAALAQRQQGVDLALLLEVDSTELTERLSGRLTCRSCAATYHPRLLPSAEGGICDRCGGPLYVRDDDQAEIVHARLSVYERETEPLLTYYARDARLQRENGVGAIEEVWRRVQRAIDEVRRRRSGSVGEEQEKERSDESTRVGQTAL
jgi:adenylate kinase